jgi:hypothetical protein
VNGKRDCGPLRLEKKMISFPSAVQAMGMFPLSSNVKRRDFRIFLPLASKSAKYVVF